MTADKHNKASNQSEDTDSSKADSCQSTAEQDEAEPLTPYEKKISEGSENLRGRENWFRQRSGNSKQGS